MNITIHKIKTITISKKHVKRYEDTLEKDIEYNVASIRLTDLSGKIDTIHCYGDNDADIDIEVTNEND